MTIASRAEIVTYLGKDSSLTEAENVLLNMIHPMAEAALKSFIQNDLGYSQHTEYYPLGQPDTGQDYRLADYEKTGGRVVATSINGSSSSDEIILQHTPVIETSLAVYEDVAAHGGQNPDGAFAASTLLTFGTDYWLDEEVDGLSETGILRRVGRWPVEPRSVKVVYYGGWTGVQLDGVAGAVKLAAIQTVAKAFWQTKSLQKTTGAGGVQSESIGKYSYSSGSGLTNTGMVQAIPLEAQQLLQPYRSYRYV